MAESPIASWPTLPIPVFRISSKVEKYMLYDIEVITWLRREHHILGVLMGTLHQIPQQNVFLGLPLELLPEEVLLLVEKGIAYIVDDDVRHQDWVNLSGTAGREAFRAMLRAQGREAAQTAAIRKQAAKESAQQQQRALQDQAASPASELSDAALQQPERDSLFQSDGNHSRVDRVPDLTAQSAWSVTPTTSSLLLSSPGTPAAPALPKVRAASFAIFKHLHQQGYFMTPGLRFGCQFTAYPGDPLRYHSHFLAVGADWDEDLDLMDIIGGGRLGTGVKKGFLIGGQQPVPAGGKPITRAFCIEWGGM